MSSPAQWRIARSIRPFVLPESYEVLYRSLRRILTFHLYLVLGAASGFIAGVLLQSLPFIELLTNLFVGGAVALAIYAVLLSLSALIRNLDISGYTEPP